MKRKLLLGIGLAALVPVLALVGCSAGPTTIETVHLDTQQTGIWVSGQGKVTAVPDVAVLRLGVESQQSTVAEAQAEASVAMDQIMTVLKSNGIDDKDIQTQYYSIYQVTRWDDSKNEEIVTGYRVSNSVTAKIRDVDNTGSVIDAVAGAGGDLTRINGISFTVDDPSVYEAELMKEAMADAKSKAETLAAQGGLSLGSPVYISTSTYTPVSYRAEYDMAVPAPMAAVGETSISAGEMEITLTVQVNYAIN